MTSQGLVPARNAGLSNLVPRACDPWEGNEGSGIIHVRNECDWLLVIQWNVAILQKLIFNRNFYIQHGGRLGVYEYCFGFSELCYILILQRKCKETYT